MFQTNGDLPLKPMKILETKKLKILKNILQLPNLKEQPLKTKLMLNGFQTCKKFMMLIFKLLKILLNSHGLVNLITEISTNKSTTRPKEFIPITSILICHTHNLTAHTLLWELLTLKLMLSLQLKQLLWELVFLLLWLVLPIFPTRNNLKPKPLSSKLMILKCHKKNQRSKSRKLLRAS